MKQLDRYIGRSVILSTFFAVLVLLILVSFIELIAEMGDVGRGRYRVVDAFFYVLLIMPRRIYEVFPLGALLGSLIGLGGLASHSELMAMRVAGVSLTRIIVALLKAGLVMMLVVILVGELIAPYTEHYGETMRSTKISNKITLKSKYGFWARDGRAFVNIRQILPGARLKDIYIYEFSKGRELKVATYAAFAQYREDNWLLNDIQQSEFTQDGVVSRTIKAAEWDSMLDPSLLNIIVMSPKMLPVGGLYHYIKFLDENGQSAISYEVAFWSKMVMPLVTLVMVFLAVPFVFGVLRSVGIGQRIFAGSIIGIGFFLLNKVFGHMAVVYELNPLFAASFPGLLVLAVSLWFLRRVH